MSYGYPGGDPNQGGYGQSGPQQPGGYGQQPGGYDPNQGAYGQSGPQQPGGYGQGYGTGGGGGYGTGGGGYGGQPGGQPPQNYLVWTILSLICCGGVLAIPAIVFATQVNSKWAAGDYAGAEDSSRKAKMWLFIAVGVAAVIYVIVGIFYVIALASASSYSSY